ncbi:5-oxoprolinase subunit PxpB [Lentibacillus jeotgali]|uniref:5-oxoprolinase subunit PxpB n=1 Tax=Lentibacillus jeotgali TaxID=558169 RepID=UPI0002626C49|nr:5-oxoprolinase subunit PxpB [Lentibacillus jeotgali]
MISCDPVGDAAIRIKFNEDVTPTLNRKIRSFCRRLSHQAVEAIIEWVPSFDSVTVYYSPYHMSYETIRNMLLELASGDMLLGEDTKMLVKIPVFYGGSAGPDLEKVAKKSGLSVNEVIEKHSGVDYLIYMIGFLPGFPYLGGLPKELATPRLDNPRSSVPAGSVGIAGSQTGAYPLASPGGWNLIGQTPVKLFDPDRDAPFLYQAGDKIRFVPVSESDYRTIEKQVHNNTFQVEKEVIRNEQPSD